MKADRAERELIEAVPKPQPPEKPPELGPDATPSSARGRLRRVLYGGSYLDAEKIGQLLENHQEHGGSLYETLYKDKNLKPIDRCAFFCELFEHLAYLDVSEYKVNPLSLLQLVPRAIAEKHMLVPLAKIEQIITVAMSNPMDLIALDDISRHTDSDVLVVISSSDQIKAAIDRNYARLEQEEKAKVKLTRHTASEEEMKQAVEAAQKGVAAKGKEEDEETVVRLVELILQNALHRNASDIHLEPYEQNFRLRYRVDGRLVQVLEGDRKAYAPIVSRMKILSNLDIAEHRIPQDGRMKLLFEERDIDFRVSVLPTQFGEKVVMRILDKSGLKLDFTVMGFEPEARDMLLKAIQMPNGICLVTGPTGSGKSTTLYSALNHLNDTETNIITLEDPVEYNIFGINQVQCNAKVGLTFASGLRSILRQDPDVIMVGEIRDQETADIAVKSALTGHLVLSTLHTNDAPGAISRLLDMGLEPFMLAASMNLCEAQRLVRKICPKCKKAVKIPQTFLNRYKNELPPELANATHTYAGAGCGNCNNTGYKGRTCVVEIMVVTPTIKDMISEGATIAAVRQKAIEEGMITLLQNGIRKAFNGVTTLEEVLRVTSL